MFDLENLSPRKLVGGGIVAVGLIGTLMFGAMTTEKVSQGHVGVVYSAGDGVEEKLLDEGWHFFIPPWKKVTEYPVALETVQYDKISLATKDGKPISFDMTFNYMNETSKVDDIFTKFKGAKPEAIEDSFLLSRAKESALSVTSKYTVLEVFQKREEIKTEISQKFTEDLAKHGFIVSDFVLGTAIPDENTATAIQRVVDAQQNLESMKIETQQAREKAEKAKVEAQGVADALIIEAEGRAKANKMITESLSDNVIEYEYIKKWDGVEPTTKVTGSESGVIIGK